ncbi:MAG: glycosyltransferase family 39 protein [Candidatus Omnitrophica bacterium]|nr:glycosyltransferase family 39 protein [Candidatus Omnitrophota bacterium]
MNEAVFYRSLIHSIPSFISKYANGTLDAQVIIEDVKGWPPSSAKPMHSFFIYLYSYAVGLDVFSSKCVAATFGIFSVIMLFMLMRLWYGTTIAIVAALFLACSGYHIYVSRIGGPETISTFFILCAWYWYGKSCVDKNSFGKNNYFILLCGIALGLCFTTCYRWIIVIPIIWIYESVRFVKVAATERKVIIKRILLLTISFLFLPILCEMVYWPLHYMPHFEVSFRHMPKNIFGYFNQLIYYLVFQSKAGTFLIHDLYIDFFLKLNGVALTSLSLIGLIMLIKRHSPKDLLVALPGLIVFTVLSIKTRGNSLRYISLALPFIAALAAVALVQLFLYIPLHKKTRTTLIAITALIVSYTSIYNIIELTTIRAGYQSAMEYLRQNHGERHLSTSNAYSEFYFGRNVAEQTPARREDLKTLLQEGAYRYVVLDFMSHRVLKKDTKAIIENYCTPVARIKNDIGKNYFTLIESVGYRHHKKNYIRDALNDPHAAFIEIYDADAVLRVLSVRNRL